MPRAVTYAQTGGPEVLEISDIAMPQPGAGEVRIKVAVASANLIDVKLRRGDLPFPQQFPVTPGMDGAGTVDALGAGVTDLSVGDEVFGAGRGTYAEYAILTAAQRKPDTVDDQRAAAIATPGEAAFRALTHLAVHAGQTVLIHGAAGGVGAIAVQLAVKQGITVIGTVSETDFDYVRDLGAIPVAYGPGWVQRARAAAPARVDAVLDTAGANVLPESIELTGSADHVVTLADFRAEELGVRFTGSDPADRRYDAYPILADLLARGELDVRIGRTYRLDQVREMHEALERGGTPGKLLLLP